MPAAFRAFLTALVDYAGLFPPAALDLAPAIRNHLGYREGADAWMLGRFIVPGGRLGDLDAFADEIAASGADGPGADGPVTLSVLGLREAGGLVETAHATLAAAREAEARHGGALRCDRFELRAAPEAAGRIAALADMPLAEGDGIAVELPMTGEGYARAAVEEGAHAVAEANARTGRQAFALKLRCGGVTPDLVPGVEPLAHAVAACRSAGAPFKATAGLHHPVRHYNEGAGMTMHGFINLFGGAALALAHGLGADDIAEVLDETDPARFHLADDLAWRGLRVAAPRVHEARQRLALSYGSCSFDEPREDLQALGWMPATVT